MRAVDAADVADPNHGNTQGGSWGKKQWKLLEADGTFA